MTVREYFEKNPKKNVSIVWAYDAPGFGKKGSSVYGDCLDFEVVSAERDMRYKQIVVIELRIWNSKVFCDRRC